MSTTRAPSPILKWFRWDHLPKPLQETSAKFAALAHEIEALPDGPQKQMALEWLLVSKDAAVRAAKDGEDLKAALAIREVPHKEGA